MKNIFKVICVAILLSNCGFKVVNQSENIKYYITSINVIGDKRINYKIRSKLSASLSDASKKPIILNINSKKIKNIKEKNIKNEITKYQITINVTIEIFSKDNKNLDEIVLSKSGDYSVVKEYSKTINNEKKLIEILTNELLEDIISNLSERDDL